jgi:capsular exopolysaccharide synthesis family protein
MSMLEDTIHQIKLDDGVVLNVLTTGTLPPNPAELLGSDRMRTLLREMEESFDNIILDSPPLNVVTDAAILGTLADGVIVVARAGVTTGDGLSFALELLRNVRAKIIGTVLNGVDFKRDSRYYGSYGYNYGYYNYQHATDEG